MQLFRSVPRETVSRTLFKICKCKHWMMSLACETRWTHKIPHNLYDWLWHRFFSTFHHSRKASFYYNILGQIKYTKHTNLSYTLSNRDYFVLNTQQQAFGINKVLAPGQPLQIFSNVDGPGACTPPPIDMRLYLTLQYKSHSVYFH